MKYRHLKIQKMTVVELLRTIQYFEAQLMFVALTLYLFWFRRLDNYSTTVILILLLNGLHFYVEGFIWDYGIANNGENYWSAIAVWHLFFSISDFIFVFVIFFVNRKFGHQSSKFMIYAANTYFLMGLIQIARYADRIVFKTEIFAGAYKHGIPTLNTAMALIVVATSVIAIRSDLKLKGSISK